MELKVNEMQALEPITFNYEDLKEELSEKVKVYETTVYTEETVKEAKTDRAGLNKLSTAIDNERKRIKAEVLKPFETFEAQTKELKAIVDNASNCIDKQVKTFEERQKEEKRQQIVGFFESNADELIEILNFDKIYNEKWLNLGYKIEDIEKEIKTVIGKTRSDLKVIGELKTEFDLQLKDLYLKTLDLTVTLAEKTRLEEQKKKLEGLNKNDEEKKTISDWCYGARIRLLDEKFYEDNNKYTLREFESIVPRNIQVPFAQNLENSTNNKELQQIDFKVWVTQEQKVSLREFLIKNNIKFGKVGN